MLFSRVHNVATLTYAAGLRNWTRGHAELKPICVRVITNQLRINIRRRDCLIAYPKQSCKGI
jgi:hypothetical protein